MSNRVQDALSLLRAALAASLRRGATRRADRIQSSITTLTPPEPWPALDRARHQSGSGPRFGVNECQLRVRLCFDVPSVGDFDGDGMADAEDAWKASTGKHLETDPQKIPRGFPVFWSGGSHDNGHVAIAAGRGLCWSTDIRRPGFFDLVPISEIHDRWGLTLLGWVDVYDGFKLEHGKAVR